MRLAARLAVAAVVGLSAALAPASADDADGAAGGARGGYVVAHVRPGSVVPLRLHPRGRVVARLHARTEFGSPQRLAVVRRRASRWLAVTTPAVRNRVGWIEHDPDAVGLTRVRVALEVDLSRRELRVLRGGRRVRVVRVAIGRPGSPTPLGRFHVTDKLVGAEYGAYYGCCILALSGRQTRLPRGWAGGNRLAIHGTPSPALVGGAVSAGCLHARVADLRYLMRTIQLGTPVFIRA